MSALNKRQPIWVQRMDELELNLAANFPPTTRRAGHQSLASEIRTCDLPRLRLGAPATLL